MRFSKQNVEDAAAYGKHTTGSACGHANTRRIKPVWEEEAESAVLKRIFPRERHRVRRGLVQIAEVISL